MKFSHMADCHVGSYRDQRMRKLTIDAFSMAIERSLAEKVDFILISGDLFNTSMPSIDSLKIVTSELKKVALANIPVYIIAGSHDFSPSGKTMLDVLENAGLCINVVKGTVNNDRLVLSFTEDKKTSVKIAGMIGKKGTLEKAYYESLETSNLEKEEGFKIFMFHSAITELKPPKLENAESTPMSYLPKNFNYYAGGHVHSIIKTSSKELGGVIAYPGPLFPNSFSEIEELGNGGFYMFDSSDSELLKYISINVKDVFKIFINAEGKTPEKIISELNEYLDENFKDKIVLIRISGKLSSGRASDINMNTFFDELYSRGAYFVMRNTASLTSDIFQ
ncbi:MAG: DNA repair exonuclease, partial [Nanoarchaeota archaeon]